MTFVQIVFQDSGEQSTVKQSTFENLDDGRDSGQMASIGYLVDTVI